MGKFWVILLAGAALWAQTVKITWVGQACFVVQSEGGPNVIVDPPAANIGYPLPQLAADAVLVTHNHGDHNNVAGVRGSPVVIDGRPTTERAEMSAAGLPFVLIPGFHDNQNGAARGGTLSSSGPRRGCGSRTSATTARTPSRMPSSPTCGIWMSCSYPPEASSRLTPNRRRPW